MNDRKTLSLDEVLANIDGIGQLIRDHAPAGEADRRVDDEVMAALHEAGAMATFLPPRYGGPERSVEDFLKISRQVALYDGGTSWVVTLASLGHWMSTLFPESAQDAVRNANPDAVISAVVAPSSKAVPVEGGYRLTGKWFYNSSSWYTDAAVLGAPLMNEQGERECLALVLVPRDQYKIEDTWFTVGMRASASNCIVLEDGFVPDDHVIRIPDVLTGKSPGLEVEGAQTVTATSLQALFCLGLIGPILGLGAAALEHVKAKMPQRPVSYTLYPSQADSVAHQVELARAATLIDTAHLHAYRGAETIESAAREGRLLTRVEIGQVRADTGWAADCTVEAIGKLIDVHGAGTFAESNPLQRMWRDANVAARHAAITSSSGWEIYGKAMLGSTVPVSIFERAGKVVD